MARKKPILEAMDEILDWTCDEEEDSTPVDLKDTNVQMARLAVKKLVERAQVTMDEIQDYEGGRMDPKDLIDNLHSDWISLVQQMDRVHTLFETLGVDLSNTSLYTRRWK
jgi:hypothetical protein